MHSHTTACDSLEFQNTETYYHHPQVLNNHQQPLRQSQNLFNLINSDSENYNYLLNGHSLASLNSKSSSLNCCPIKFIQEKYPLKKRTKGKRKKEKKRRRLVGHNDSRSPDDGNDEQQILDLHYPPLQFDSIKSASVDLCITYCTLNATGVNESSGKSLSLQEYNYDQYTDLRISSDDLTATHSLSLFTKRSSHFSVLLYYWHALSVLACFFATGFCVQVPTTSSLFISSLSFQNDVSITANMPSKCPIEENPLLTISRSARNSLLQMSYIWTPKTINDLCSLRPLERYERFGKIHLFSYEANASLKLSQLFLFNDQKIHHPTEIYMKRLAKHMKYCILSKISARCSKCFSKIDKSLQRIETAYRKFNQTLHRFDCMLSVGSSSVTRPFSPNGTCGDCKMWYHRWLLMQFIDVWLAKPCINWCYYAQLACPHLATSKNVDYAGHPSFQCRDQIISRMSPTNQQEQSFASECHCLHPCDLFPLFYVATGIPDDYKLKRVKLLTKRVTNRRRLRSFLRSDESFFPSPEHCSTRWRVCSRQRTNENKSVQSTQNNGAVP